ncbi:peptidylprolyl isomerase [Flavobacterium branchiophilum]|uniref:Periplasmic chaperone for outer membrane proteins SurA n=1 Tax=Flavobacterium branchiophilum TaxID=55197 RepID=A0A543G5E5_9FLAO|nr:peptidylprolyl isomerase [Flavobacterium branchiophilum]OXA79766.1 peptidylprolyl isomerase [Flavobacterium branchiophilum] [Flavobacterium branchiophilum NBRC 15030 = ATCC 35035]TQM41299.1 periplasmic chaperone for outer membrane proteins SurA [Flavobacterium branchiophilum]GEM56098.1 peptidylprolyl isomerase [Flavobacterium branchiophilum NBRC 15030 = ATCC 35035]
MKYLQKIKFTTFCLFLLAFSIGHAQEIIKETSAVVKTDTTKNKKRKVDGIVANVGDYIILDSDIDKAFIEISSQGNSIKDISRCQMLGKLLEDKLYAHQAIQDSIVVSDADVKLMMEERINYMVENVGSMEKVLKYYKKDSEEDFKSYFFDILKENKLTSDMQKKIIDGVEITPEEVRTFFKKIPQNELPIIGTEVEVAQIVVAPKVAQEEKQAVIDKLKGFKKEVMEGVSFATKAVLYTQDPGSRANGGFYKMNRKTPFVKEFKDVAFSLAEGEISEPFETDFGYHIIMVEKIKGQDVELRHILLTPKTTQASLDEAKEKISLIKKRIEDKEISFAEAARQMSDEKETRTNGGQLINPKTQDTRFDLTKMDPTLYADISNLKTKEITIPLVEEDQKGGKKYKIITITNRITEHTADYGKDYIKIKELALKEKQIKAIAKWMDNKIKETYVKINADYQDCAFTNNWLKK